MRIDTLYVENLHGYITGGIKLNSDLNILYGKNGSGKTTALNLLRLVLNFDFSALRQIKFKYLVLTYIDNDRKGRIELNRRLPDSESLAVDDAAPVDLRKLEAIVSKDRLEDQRIFITLFDKTIGRKQVSELDKLRDVIRQISNIRSRSNITLVNIDRTMYVTSRDGGVAVDVGASKQEISASRRKEVGKDPLDVVQGYCSENFVKFTNENDQIKTKFINDLMISFLDWDKIKSADSDTVVTLDQLDQLEAKFKHLGLLDGGSSDRILKKFFTDTRKILTEANDKPASVRGKGRKTQREELDALLKKMSLTRAGGLLTSINEMEMRIQEARSVIDKYLNSINSFFRATGKEIKFSPTDNKLHFHLTQSGEDDVSRDLSELSSGERQVIIVLTYLYFVAKEDSIFIVDEPELSLHLAWQRKFVDQMKTLAPRNCQIVLASHSPEIVGAHRSVVQKVFSDTTRPQ